MPHPSLPWLFPRRRREVPAATAAQAHACTKAARPLEPQTRCQGTANEGELQICMPAVELEPGGSREARWACGASWVAFRLGDRPCAHGTWFGSVRRRAGRAAGSISEVSSPIQLRATPHCYIEEWGMPMHISVKLQGIHYRRCCVCSRDGGTWHSWVAVAHARARACVPLWGASKHPSSPMCIESAEDVCVWMALPSREVYPAWQTHEPGPAHM